MSEFDKLKDEAEKETREHPEQVRKGEQAVEKKLGGDSEDDQHDHGNAPPGDGDGQQQGDRAGQSQNG